MPIGTKLCLAFEVFMAHGYILQVVAYKKKKTKIFAVNRLVDHLEPFTTQELFAHCSV